MAAPNSPRPAYTLTMDLASATVNGEALRLESDHLDPEMHDPTGRLRVGSSVTMAPLRPRRYYGGRGRRGVGD